MKIIKNRSRTLAWVIGGSVAAAMFAFTAQAQNAATVTGRLTNASGQPEAASTPCVAEPGSPGVTKAVNTSRSNKKAALGAVATDDLDASRAPVSTSRSNKKHAKVAADTTEASSGPPGAPVVTSRSNKKAGVVARPTPALAEDGCTAGPSSQAPQAQREVKPVAGGSVVIRKNR